MSLIPAPIPLRVITVSLFQNGSLQVSGAIQDRIGALGMLELAKHSVNTMHDRQAADRGGNIQTADGSLLRSLDEVRKNGKESP